MLPPEGSETKIVPFIAKLSLDGTLNGSTNLALDTRATARRASVRASDKFDIYIVELRIGISAAKSSTSKFGNITPAKLTNGLSVSLHTGDIKRTLVENAKTHGQILAQSNLSALFGSGNAISQVKNWDGKNTLSLATFDFARNGLGIRLGAGTKDRIEALLNDDYSSLNDLFIVVSGFTHHA